MTVCICEPTTPDVTSAISLTSDLFVGWIFGWIHINRLLDWKILWIKSHGWYPVISACLPPPPPKICHSHTQHIERERSFSFFEVRKNYLLRVQALRSNGIYVWYWKRYVCADRKLKCFDMCQSGKHWCWATCLAFFFFILIKRHEFKIKLVFDITSVMGHI